MRGDEPKKDKVKLRVVQQSQVNLNWSSFELPYWNQKEIHSTHYN